MGQLGVTTCHHRGQLGAQSLPPQWDSLGSPPATTVWASLGLSPCHRSGASLLTPCHGTSCSMACALCPLPRLCHQPAVSLGLHSPSKYSPALILPCLQAPRVCDLGQAQLQNQPSSCSNRIDSWHLVISEGRLKSWLSGTLQGWMGFLPKAAKEVRTPALPCPSNDQQAPLAVEGSCL